MKDFSLNWYKCEEEYSGNATMSNGGDFMENLGGKSFRCNVVEGNPYLI